ncbi:MAG: 23S rRNA (guanosine(2251)-2'-O)-methyltransferase RlmB [Chitinophagales bacterium]|nr:23S rRNA (guanosine(2251)-2'-O)-methyltransferase RlmB [Chitinophagales bacterium]
MEESYCIVGRKPVAELLRAGKAFAKVMLQSGLKSEDLEAIAAEARKAGVQVQYVPKEKLDFAAKKFSKERYVNHQGVVALAAMGKVLTIEELLSSLEQSNSTPLLVVFDGITDVGNLGAIARSALCFGAHALVMPSAGSAPVNPEGIKRSAGALEQIPLCRVENISMALKLLKAHGIKIFAASEDAETPIQECDFSIPCAVVLGDEGKGISTVVLRQCDGTFAIPMKDNFDSLNVSVSAGITLYEAMQQREAKQ